MHARLARAVALATLLAGGPALVPVGAPVVAAVAAGAPPKIAIVVGATETTTSTYRSYADAIAASAVTSETAAYGTANVVKVYSPNATWAAVKAAAQGASIFVYLGHGNGWPSPYSTTLVPDVQDGMGLNATANNGDSDKKYYGENCVDGLAAPTSTACPNNGMGIRFAANAIVFLNHLCYAPGEGEPGMVEPTIDVAKQRVDNFASGFIRAGARAVIADDYTSSVQAAIQAIFTTHQSMLSVWRSLPGYHGNEIPWAPARNPAFQAVMDPVTWTSQFYRSIVTDAALKTDNVLAGAGLGPTNVDPATLTAPGAASVATSALAVATDQTLAAASGITLAAGTRLRVDQIVANPPAADGTTPPPSIQVHTLDGSISGWVSAAGLTPRDSAGPQLWSTTGPTTISPNYDGTNDQLALWDRLSEVATWTATVVGPDGTILRTQTGTSDLPPPSWNALVGGNPAPAGTYHWTLHATDAWGNPALDAAGDVTVVTQPIPTTALLAFKALNGSYTTASTLAFELDFASAVTGLTAGDLSRAGTATSCVVNAPTGSGATWYVTVSSCSDGTVGLTLAAASVLDASLVTGPSVAVAGPIVKIDRTRPTQGAPRLGLKTGVTMTGSTLPAAVSWSATDTGTGVASYDVARSVDGGAFAVIANRLTTASLAQGLASGHSYRYEVRARDRAGNLSSWVAGPTLSASLIQQTSGSVTWSGAWATVSSTAYSGGSARTSTTGAASATLTFTGRVAAIVVSRDPSYGQVRVYLDGAYLATVDTTAGAHYNRNVVYARALTYGTHTLKLVVVGTSGRPRVVLDGYEVIR